MVSSREDPELMEAVKALGPRILAERERIEAERRLPEELVRELAPAGFFRIFLPAAYGGLDLTSLAAAEVFEELARADASVAWCVWNGNTYWTTVRWAKEVGQAIFADPDAILANSTRPSGRAVIVEGGYRVSGRWSLISPVGRPRSTRPAGSSVPSGMCMPSRSKSEFVPASWKSPVACSSDWNPTYRYSCCDA